MGDAEDEKARTLITVLFFFLSLAGSQICVRDEITAVVYVTFSFPRHVPLLQRSGFSPHLINLHTIFIQIPSLQTF